MVAKSFLGRSSSLATSCMRFDLSPSCSSTSLLVKEKRATSAPDTIAEHANRKNKSAKPNTTEKSIVKKEILKLAGSGSK